MASARQRLNRKLDKVGWRAPYHQHFKTVVNGEGGYPRRHDKPPVYCMTCAAHECEAEGCPRTESGFPSPGAVQHTREEHGDG